jgi:hypothetical protein
MADNKTDASDETAVQAEDPAETAEVLTPAAPIPAPVAATQAPAKRRPGLLVGIAIGVMGTLVVLAGARFALGLAGGLLGRGPGRGREMPGWQQRANPGRGGVGRFQDGQGMMGRRGMGMRGAPGAPGRGRGGPGSQASTGTAVAPGEDD